MRFWKNWVSPGFLTFLDKDGKEVLSGTDVADAQAAYQTNSMNNQEPVVSLTMTARESKKFAVRQRQHIRTMMLFTSFMTIR